MIGTGTILVRIAEDLISKSKQMSANNIQGATMKEVGYSILNELQKAIDEDEKGKTDD